MPPFKPFDVLSILRKAATKEGVAVSKTYSITPMKFSKFKEAIDWLNKHKELWATSPDAELQDITQSNVINHFIDIVIDTKVKLERESKKP